MSGATKRLERIYIYYTEYNIHYTIIKKHELFLDGSKPENQNVERQKNPKSKFK